MAEEFTPSVANEANPGPTLQEQADAMGITYEGSPEQPAQEQPDTSNLILGKFTSQTDLEQAYQNLEQRLGQGAPGLTDSLTQASEYYGENGELSDEHYEALSSVGIDRSIVDSYISGQNAQTAQETLSYYNTVGGEENYTQMTEWMQDSLQDTEIDAYNRVIGSGSDDEVRVLMSGMYARYQAASGTNYNQVQGKTTPEAPPGFESRGQVMEMLNDPRYEYDAAYRAEFERKLALTSETIF